MGSRRSTRLNVTISGVAPPPQVSTMGTTAAVTTTTRAVPSRQAQVKSLHGQREPNTLPSPAQTSHPCASHAEQPTLVAQPAPVAQHTPDEQPTLVAQPAPVAFQAAQIDPRLVQPFRLQISGPTIELGAFSPYFYADLTFPNSNLTPGVYHISIAQ
ncbi:hypothetical protein ACFX2C_017076 [Malus domestica]